MSERALSSAFIASTFTCTQYSISALLLKRQYSDKAVYMVNKKEYFTTIPIYMDTPVSVTTKSYSSAMEKLTSFPNCSNVPPVLNPRCYPSASFANCWLVCLKRIRLTICCKKAGITEPVVWPGVGQVEAVLTQQQLVQLEEMRQEERRNEREKRKVKCLTFYTIWNQHILKNQRRH